jgi:hypothetical protein
MPETKRRDIDSLRLFLLSRGWLPSRGSDKFERYSPPSTLNVGDRFYITLPKGAVTSGTNERYFNEVSKILSQLYGWAPENLERAVDAVSTVFSVKFYGDEQTQQGTISLVDFEAFVSRVKNLIRDTADFTASNMPFVGPAREMAHAFINGCLFLQTEKGSFVTRIDLPSAITLREGDMLQSAITGEHASDRLADVLAFVSDRVLKGDPKIYEEEIFVDAGDVLNVNVLEDVETLVEHLGGRSVAFHFARADMERSIAPGRITTEEMAKLSQYVKFVRDKLSQQVPINVVGSVVQLRSHDPEGNRNVVTIRAEDKSFNLPIFVALDSARYSQAVEAHVNKRPVRVRGIAVKLVTQIKVIQLDAFGLLGDVENADQGE